MYICYYLPLLVPLYDVPIIFIFYMKNKISTGLSLLYWNIDSIHYRIGGTRLCKIDDDDVKSLLVKHDIICLVETHCGFSDNIDLLNYSVIMNVRPKTNNAKKHSGGLAVYVKSTIRPGIKFMPITNSEIMWFKLKNNFLI